MYKYFASFLTLLLLLTTTVGAQTTVTFASDDFIFKVNLDTFKDNYFRWQLNNVTVYRLPDTVKVQVIKAGMVFEWLPNDEDFIIEDVNFDGFDDFRIMTQPLGRGGNASFEYWLYDSVTKRFYADEAISLTSPSFDHEHQVITENLFSPGGGTISTDYKLVNGKLVRLDVYNKSLLKNHPPHLIKKHAYDKKRKLYITTTSKLVNGKMKVIKRVTSKSKPARFKTSTR